MIRPWYKFKVGDEVVAETDVLSEVLVWSTVYLAWGLNNVTVFCTVKEEDVK